MSTGTVFFRADGNKNIGIGHVMRCLSIADGFSTKGYRVCFITADHFIEDIIKGRGYDTDILNSDYSDMENELPKLNDLFIRERNSRIRYIIVDSYYVTYDYFSGLRMLLSENPENTKIVYVDDLGRFPYPVDVLINYNLYGPDIDYQTLYKVDIPEMILGPKYIPLRSMFRGLPVKVQNKAVKDVLISTGGSDPYHLTIDIIRSIVDRYGEGLHITPKYHLLVGSMNQDLNKISELVENQANIVLHVNESDMRSLICEMDICVSASGSTLYEICACGVPLITYVMADNQRMGADAFEKKKLSYNIGDVRNMDDPAEAIMSAIEYMSQQYGYRMDMAKRMQELVDGYGTDKIVDTLISMIVNCD